MTRDQIGAQMEADALMAIHAQTINDALYIFGAEGTADILRALATKIEDGTFNRERLH